MRRYTALVMGVSMVLSLSACDAKEIADLIQAEVEQAEAAPSGLSDKEALALFAALAEEGERTFWWYMDIDNSDLLIDETAEPVDEFFHPVGRFETIAELKAATEQVFTKRFCKTVLYPVGFGEEQGDVKFREIDGELYCNAHNGSIGWMPHLTGEMSVAQNTYKTIVVTVVVEEPYYLDGGEPIVRQTYKDFALVREDGDYKLDNWYDYGTTYVSASIAVAVN